MSDDDLIRRGDALAACEPRGYDHAHHMQAKADCVAAITALPAVTPRVKPLVWECLAPRVIEAPGFNCRYQIRLATDGSIRWQGRYMGSWEDADSVDAAKAAAQADYEARIFAALDMQPAPDMERLIKDAERRGQIKAGAIFANYGTNEDDYAAAVHNACTHCNGSGHKDDVKPAPDAQAIRDAALREVTDRVGECLAGMAYSAVSRFAREKIFLALIGTTAEGGA